MKKLIPILIVVCWGASMAQSPSASLKQSEIQIQVDKVKKEIEEEEKAWAEELNRENDAEKKRKERYESFVQEKQEIQKSIATVEGQVDERLAQIERMKGRDLGAQSQIKFLRTVVLEQARQFKEVIQTGFPYRTEKRLETVQLLIDDLAKERVSPEEGFNRLWVMYSSEHTIASDAEIYSGNIIVNNQNVAVKFMRVGKQILAYTTPSGDQLGVLVQMAPGRYEYIREDKMDFRTRTAVRDAIAVAEGKALPGFVEFPFWPVSFEHFNPNYAKNAVAAPADTTAADSTTAEPAATKKPTAKKSKETK